MTTREAWVPQPKATPVGAQVTYNAARNEHVWSFDGFTNEAIELSTVVGQVLTGASTLRIYFRMSSAISGSVVVDVSVEAITPADALNTLSTRSYAAANRATQAVPNSQGVLGVISVALTSRDSMAAGDILTVKIERVANDVGDTAVGDMEVVRVELRDAGTA